MGVDVEFTDWEHVAGVLKKMPSTFDRARNEAIEEEARFMKEKFAETLRRGVPPPKSTLLGGGGPALTSLAPQVEVRKIGNAVVVGLSSSGGARGKSYAELGQLHEEGRSYHVPMTDKQRRWLFAALRAAGHERSSAEAKRAGRGNAVINITIPRRPWFAPTVARWARPDAVKARIALSMAKRLGVFTVT